MKDAETIEGTNIMNREELTGNWNQLSGKIKQKWGKLTDDDLKVAQGNHQELVGKIQERYGIAKEEAEREVDMFLTRH